MEHRSDPAHQETRKSMSPDRNPTSKASAVWLQHTITVSFVICLLLSQVCDFLPKRTVHSQSLRRPRGPASQLTLPCCGVLLAPRTHGLGSPTSLAPESEWFIPISGAINKLELSGGTNAFVVMRESHPSFRGPFPGCVQLGYAFGLRDRARLQSHTQQPCCSVCLYSLPSRTRTGSHQDTGTHRCFTNTFKLLQANTHGTFLRRKISLCFICGSDVCVYIHIKKDLEGYRANCSESSSWESETGGKGVLFYLWWFFIRSIYNFYNAIFYVKRTFFKAQVQAPTPTGNLPTLPDLLSGPIPEHPLRKPVFPSPPLPSPLPRVI